MTGDDLRVLQGTNALVQTGIETGARRVLEVQLSLTQLPYAALRRAHAPACLVNGIEKTQETITYAAYGGVVLGSRAARAAIDVALAVWARGAGASDNR